MVTGTFTTDATPSPINISLPSGYDYIEILNTTDFGSTAANTNVVRARGYSSLPAGYASYNTKTNGAATLAIETMGTTGGFTFISDSASVALGTPVTNVSAINRANPAVVSTANPVANGSVVRMYGTTGMLQLAGYEFTTAGYNAGVSFTLAYLNNSGWAADATAGSFVTVPFDARFYPRRRFITAITAANPAVVTLSVTHGYAVGEKVRMVVPTQYGMTQMNGLLATITAISTANNTITLDVDSSAFTAFAFPTSAVYLAGCSPAVVVPVGEAVEYPYGLYPTSIDAVANQSFNGVQIGATVLVASKSYSYVARKGVAL
jgi:hypothetical protein